MCMACFVPRTSRCVLRARAGTLLPTRRRHEGPFCSVLRGTPLHVTPAVTSSGSLTSPRTDHRTGTSVRGRQGRAPPFYRAPPNEWNGQTRGRRRAPHRRGNLGIRGLAAVSGNIHNAGSPFGGAAADAVTDAEERPVRVDAVSVSLTRHYPAESPPSGHCGSTVYPVPSNENKRADSVATSRSTDPV